MLTKLKCRPKRYRQCPVCGKWRLRNPLLPEVGVFCQKRLQLARACPGEDEGGVQANDQEKTEKK